MHKRSAADAGLCATASQSSTKSPASVMFNGFETNIDCWATLNQFLLYKSKARCEALCKSLAQVVEILWKAETHFDVADVRPRTVNELRWSLAIVGVCTRIGDSLRALRMSADVRLSASAFNAILAHCPNIASIRALLSDQLSELRLDGIACLKEVNFEPESRWSDDDIRALAALPRTLERLTGLQVRISSRAELILNACFPRFSALRQFEFSDLSGASIQWHRLQPFFAVIAESCPQMERVALVDCKCTNVVGIERFMNLKMLTISGDGPPMRKDPLTDDQIVEVCARNRRLESLRIGGRDQHLSARSWEAISTLRELSELEMSGGRCEICPGLFDAFTDARLLTIISSPVGASLRRLSLFWARHLTDESIDAIRRLCPNLLVLIIGCYNISPAGLRQFASTVSTRALRSTNDAPFELYVGWEDKATLAAEFAAFLNSSTLPRGIIVHRFKLSPVTIVASTIVPLVESTWAKF